MVLRHKLLLLVHSRCCRNRGRGWGPCCTGALSLDHLPAFLDTLEHAVCCTKDTIPLEHLAWAMYDNQLGSGELQLLSSFKSYRQILRCLVDKAFTGLQAHCLVHMSAVFKMEKVKVKSVVTVLQAHHRLRGLPRLETCGRSSLERTMWPEDGNNL